ncbi:MAG: SpoIIE family protein phosphatase [Spirochaetes bacterium]|jgi:serine phosphatase RsbU (regulator of sigma subunit)|nr:SpoIIE family protein phosphatase [Spirochaetota bacterium]
MNNRDLLKSIPVFSGINDDDADEILPLTHQLYFKKGSVIITEGSEGSSMYILIDGKVKVTKAENLESEVFIATLEAGSFFGELSLLDDMPRSANVIADEDCSMLHLKKRDFDNLLNSNLRISNTFYKNCLTETFSRFRRANQNFTFSQHILREKSETLDELNRDLSLAKEVQNYFINTGSHNHDNTDIRYSYIYSPCQEIGGDFLNVVPIENNYINIIIADVVGHGITAAMATGVLKSAFSLFSESYANEPAKLMKSINNHYFKIMSRFYATCYYGNLDITNMNISFAKGGHHHPLFWKESAGDFIEIEASGIGIGIMETAQYKDVTYPVESGDKILFYTDGILEQHNQERQMFSEERLRNTMRHAILEDVPEKLQYLQKEFNTFCNGSAIEDDITLLLLEI